MYPAYPVALVAEITCGAVMMTSASVSMGVMGVGAMRTGADTGVGADYREESVTHISVGGA